jgi:hypothetical protein
MGLFAPQIVAIGLNVAAAAGAFWVARELAFASGDRGLSVSF